MSFKLALKHLLSRPFLSLFTLVAISGALTILGAFWTVVENLERVKVTQSPQAGGEQLPGLTVYVDSQLPEAELGALRKKLAADTRFESVDLIPAAEALKSLESQFGETLSKAFSGDTLPVTLRLQFKKGTLSRDEFVTLLNELRSAPGVLEVDDGMAIVPLERASLSSRVFSWATGLLILVFSIVALLVSHLIRIAFENLRSEVETLKVLGASKLWIFKPLLLEGAVFGVCGGAVAVGALVCTVRFLLPRFATSLLPKGVEIMSLSNPSLMGLGGLALAASLIGALFTWPLIDQPATEI